MTFPLCHPEASAGALGGAAICAAQELSAKKSAAAGKARARDRSLREETSTIRINHGNMLIRPF
jgi:hypothetical protein